MLLIFTRIYLRRPNIEEETVLILCRRHTVVGLELLDGLHAGWTEADHLQRPFPSFVYFRWLETQFIQR